MKNAKIYKKEWFSIKDPRTLEIGMRVKTCLDISDPMYSTDDGEEDEESLGWFIGLVYAVKERSEHVSVWIKREDRSPTDGTWEIMFPKTETPGEFENLEYIFLYVKEWDD
jgi:hypothetical protein